MMINQRSVLVLAFFFVGMVIAWALGGPFYAIVFMLFWTDRVLFSVFPITKTLAVEFSALPAIMTGAVKGAGFGFGFTFFSLLIIDFIARFVFKTNPGFSRIIGFEVIFLSILAAVGGVFGGIFGPMLGSIITFAVKELVTIAIKGKLFGSIDAYFMHSINFAFNSILFVALMRIVTMLA
jgi:hypothetical protein